MYFEKYIYLFNLPCNHLLSKTSKKNNNNKNQQTNYHIYKITHHNTIYIIQVHQDLPVYHIENSH